MNYKWLKEMEDLHHGRSTSPYTLPLQRTRTHSMSASFWCFRSQHSIPMRCHRSLSGTPEDSQMNRSTHTFIFISQDEFKVTYREKINWIWKPGRSNLGEGWGCGEGLVPSKGSITKTNASTRVNKLVWGSQSGQLTVVEWSTGLAYNSCSCLCLSGVFSPQKGKEILTDNNIPHGQCVICLYGFQEKEAFTKTPCYHYFHCHCLARYIQHMEQELKAQGREQEQERQHAATQQEAVGVQCPVCREPLVYDLATLEAAPEPQQPMELYQPDAESLRQQEKRKQLYQRQQERGGIIDLEAERNRYFISLQQAPAPLEPESAVDASRGSHPPSALATELSTSSTAQPTLSTLLPVASQHTCEKISGAGPNQQRLGKTQKAMPDPPRASQDPWQPPERWHLKGGECCAPKGTSDTQELPPPEGPFKEPTDLNQGVQGHPQEKGPGSRQGPPPRRTRDCARWERSKGRTPGSSYPRLPRGRGVYRPASRREHLGLEPEDGS
ncbi:E3 ubiquitin-protein ligase RNF25 isoform X1 [Trichechus manatus latirostris]|uniref:E3 ubiquitin-protein ligase RNF25 isoform X1 n=1 Tax=Trichechus manatus latirostris TaxID=127582 RepID=A0A2Y9R0R4_TRIMA|nr:E3 ubiquitin-protein ligase RNF25 isoform X1 [Trichechus manatus latirostris]